MSELTKEWLHQTIAQLEEERDAVPGVVNEDATMALAAMRLALASLEAEAVAWIVHARTGDQLTTDGGYVANAEGILGLHSTPLYTAPPAPVSVPDEIRLLQSDVTIWKDRWELLRELFREVADALGCDVKDNQAMLDKIEMLQGADQATVKQPSSNSVLGWLRADYQDDNRGLRGNAPLFVLGKKDPSTVWGAGLHPAYQQLSGNSGWLGKGSFHL